MRFRESVRIACWGCLLSFLITSGDVAHAQGDLWSQLEAEVVEAIQTAESSVVSVARVKTPVEESESGEFDQRRSPLDDPLNPLSPEFVPAQFGSGVLIAREGHPDERLVLTNYHVCIDRFPVGDSSEARPTFFVRTGGGFAGYARIRAADARSDLAVLEFLQDWTDAERKRSPAIKFAARSPVRKGQLVVALGNPYAIGRDGSASAAFGVVGNLIRRPGVRRRPGLPEPAKDETIYQLGGLLHLDVRQHLGTSGGALINRQGELIGLTSSMAALDGYEKSAGFAIPMDEFARRAVLELASGWEVDYGLLGVQTSYVSGTARDRLREVAGRSVAPQIDSVIPNSAAGQAGMKRGDVVLSVNGREVSSPIDVTREVGRMSPATQIDLKVWRPSGGGAELNLKVQVGKWPIDDEKGIIATRSRFPAFRGVKVDYSTARRRYLSGFEYVLGVLVVEVAPGSVADSARIRAGDFISHVNGQPVRTPAEFHDRTGKVEGELNLQLADHRGPVRSVVLAPDSQTNEKPDN